VRHGIEHPHAAAARLNLAHALLAVSPSDHHITAVHTALDSLDACLAQLAAELARCDEPPGCTHTDALQATASEARALRATAWASTGRRADATAARQAEVQEVTALLGSSHAAAIAALTALAVDALEDQPPRADEAVEALRQAVSACTVEPSDSPPTDLHSVGDSRCDTAASAAAAHAANAAAVVAAAGGRLDEALTLRRQCMALANEASAPMALAAFLDNDAALLTRVGRTDEALAAASSSLRIRRRAFEDRAGSEVEAVEAVEAAEAAEAVEAVPSLRAMARAWEAKGNVDHAQRAYAAAVTLLDTAEAAGRPFGASSESAARVRRLFVSQPRFWFGSRPCMHSLTRTILLPWLGMTYTGGGGGVERLRSAAVAAGAPPPSAACPHSRAAPEGGCHEHWRRGQCGGGCGGGRRGESGHIALQPGAGPCGVARWVQ